MKCITRSSHMKPKKTQVYRLAVLNSHPIQYFTPLYRQISLEPDIDITVYFCSRKGLEEYHDPGFGLEVKWDVPLLEGYHSIFLYNFFHRLQIEGLLSLFNPSIILELIRRKYDALIVHGHNDVTTLLAIVVAKLVGTSVFMRCETHLFLERSSLKQWSRKYLMTLFYRFCNVCLPIGTRNAEFYRYHGVPDQRLSLVPYTVDNTFFEKNTDKYRKTINTLKADLNLPTNKMLILYVSKLTTRKRPLDLLKAYQILRQDGIDAALLFVGAGVEEVHLTRYVIEHDIPEVYFFGFQNQSELPKFFACADVFVLPSENEPWGLIINEAMASGLPIITTDEVGAVADLVQHGKNGYVYSVGDINALKGSLQLLGNNVPLRKQFAQNSRQLIASWNIDRSVQGIRAALDYVYAHH